MRKKKIPESEKDPAILKSPRLRKYTFPLMKIKNRWHRECLECGEWFPLHKRYTRSRCDECHKRMLRERSARRRAEEYSPVPIPEHFMNRDYVGLFEDITSKELIEAMQRGDEKAFMRITDKENYRRESDPRKKSENTKKMHGDQDAK